MPRQKNQVPYKIAMAVIKASNLIYGSNMARLHSYEVEDGYTDVSIAAGTNKHHGYFILFTFRFIPLPHEQEDAQEMERKIEQIKWSIKRIGDLVRDPVKLREEYEFFIQHEEHRPFSQFKVELQEYIEKSKENLRMAIQEWKGLLKNTAPSYTAARVEMVEFYVLDADILSKDWLDTDKYFVSGKYESEEGSRIADIRLAMIKNIVGAMTTGWAI